MAKLTKEAFAIMATCPETRKTYGITVDAASPGHFVFHWSFPVDRDRARREGYDAKHVRGSVSCDKDYPGCPYCGSKNFLFCGNCQGIICYHGQARVTCPQCGFSGEVSTVDSVDLKGGGI